MNRLRLITEWWLIAAFTLVIAIGLTLSKATESVDNVVYDALVGLHAAPPSDEIIIVAIDNQSLKSLGKWPWPRSVHAGLLDRIAKARPAAVAYDVLFTEPSIAADDLSLASAIHAAAPVSLPLLSEAPGRDGSPVDILLPIPSIGAAAKNIGHVMLATDRDGTVRRVALDLARGEQDWPHLMEQTYRDIRGHSSPAWQRSALGAEPLAIAFQPGAGRFRTISAASILAGEVPDQFLRKKIVLVGATAGGLGDQYRIAMPGGGVISGVEIQANILNSLLSDRTISSGRTPVLVAIAALVILALMAGFWWMPPARGLALALVLIAIMLVVPIFLLVFRGYWLPPSPTLIGIVIAYPLWGWRRLYAVDRAVGDELALFASERIGPDRFPARQEAGHLDRVGGHVAQLRQSISQMRDLKQLLDDTLESVSDPLVATSMAGKVLLSNEPAIALFGKDAIGANFEALIKRVTLKVQNDEGGSYVQTQDKEFSVRRSVLSDSEGHQRGWIILLVDISQIRRVEREREAALEFLSHDMRSPQAAIISLLDRDGDAFQPGTIERIRGYARRTLSLAENFVQLARLQVAPFEPEVVDLADIVTEAVDELWAQAGKKNVQLIAEPGSHDCHVMGERHALSRSLVNLLDNAVKYSPDGSQVHCRIEPDQDGAAWRCIVEDSGQGVTETLVGRLFGRFATGADGPPQSLSSGLGLAFVRASAERHGGTVHYERRSPHGSRFIFSLPAAPAAALS